mgnify:CR=1 FL=1|tara:strand:+ start:203 stop:358 length:156 start_codon:yes stop_codon:yes gene_type:complete
MGRYSGKPIVTAAAVGAAARWLRKRKKATEKLASKPFISREEGAKLRKKEL